MAELFDGAFIEAAENGFFPELDLLVFCMFFGIDSVVAGFAEVS